MDDDSINGSLIENRYRITATLGSGAYGTVYSAYDDSFGRPVAVKLLNHLNTRHWDDDRRKRFLREAKALNALNHPGIVHVHRLGLLSDGRPFIVMEQAVGETLGELIARQAPLSCADATAICIQIAEALAHAHQRGVVHRDVKPQNILISQSDGRYLARVLDFGLSALEADSADQTKLTHSGVILGTLEYTSPEQCRGAAADPRADVYSLGCVFFEMLCGVTPFISEHPVQIIWKHTSAPPPDLLKLDPQAGMPHLVGEVLSKSLAKLPEERYQDMEALLSDLQVLAQLKCPAKFKRGLVKPTPSDSAAKFRHVGLKACVALLAAAAVVICATAAAVTLTLDSAVSAVSASDFLAMHSSPQSVKDFDKSLLQVKMKLLGMHAAGQFAAAACASPVVVTWGGEQRLSLALDLQRVVSAQIQPGDCWDLPLYMFSESFHVGRGTKYDKSLIVAALTAATDWCLPRPAQNLDAVAGRFTPAQWEQLRSGLENQYEEIAQLSTDRVISQLLFARIKELAGDAALLAPGADAERAKAAWKAYRAGIKVHSADADDREFERLCALARHCDQKYNLPQQRALLFRDYADHYVSLHQYKLAKEAFTRADKTASMWYLMTDQELQEDARLRAFFDNVLPAPK